MFSCASLEGVLLISVLLWLQLTIERPGAPAVTAMASLPQHMAALFEALGWSTSMRAPLPHDAPAARSTAGIRHALRTPLDGGPEPDQAPRPAAQGDAVPPAAPWVAELPAATEPRPAAWERNDASRATHRPSTSLVASAGPDLEGGGDVLPAMRGSRGAAPGDPPRPMNRRERRRGIVARRREERAAAAAAAAQGAQALPQHRAPRSREGLGGRRAARALAAPHWRAAELANEHRVGGGRGGERAGGGAAGPAEGASNVGNDAGGSFAASQGGADVEREPDGLGAFANRCMGAASTLNIHPKARLPLVSGTGAIISQASQALCCYAYCVDKHTACPCLGTGHAALQSSPAPCCMHKRSLRAHLVCLLVVTITGAAAGARVPCAACQGSRNRT